VRVKVIIECVRSGGYEENEFKPAEATKVDKFTSYPKTHWTQKFDAGILEA
jgi:hypothetical protein